MNEIQSHMNEYLKQTLERCLKCYPKPKYHKLFIAECRSELKKKSELLDSIIRKHYDAKSKQESNSLIILWEEMTPDQRKNPATP